jgi:hypothetical protein
MTTTGAISMSKEQRSKKDVKKKPLLNPKEKKAQKKAKSEGKSDFMGGVNK